MANDSTNPKTVSFSFALRFSRFETTNLLARLLARAKQTNEARPRFPRQSSSTELRYFLKKLLVGQRSKYVDGVWSKARRVDKEERKARVFPSCTCSGRSMREKPGIKKFAPRGGKLIYYREQGRAEEAGRVQLVGCITRVGSCEIIPSSFRAGFNARGVARLNCSGHAARRVAPSLKTDN